jgi:poly(3-hydroxybutyrate) depolymerase
MKQLVLALIFVGCADETASLPDLEDGSSGDLAPLADPSSGDCPDLTQSHTTSFTSSGEDRVLTVVLPDEPGADMPLVFFFHGLLDPETMPVPTEVMADNLNLQAVANESGVAFILPQSGVMTRMGFSFYMWAADEYEGADIVLFDDLRSCAADQLDIDLHEVHAMGMSGGALFTTVVARDRGDTLASMIELSGGADIDMPTFDDILSEYGTPAAPVPALLVSGGDSDTWPSAPMPSLVNFTAATDALEGHLVSDGHFVVRCEHTLGHQVPMNAVGASWDWVEAHRFGESSPYKESGIGNVSSLSSWCTVAD